MCSSKIMPSPYIFKARKSTFALQTNHIFLSVFIIWLLPGHKVLSLWMNTLLLLSPLHIPMSTREFVTGCLCIFFTWTGYNYWIQSWIWFSCPNWKNWATDLVVITVRVPRIKSITHGSYSAPVLKYHWFFERHARWRFFLHKMKIRMRLELN